MAHPYDPFEHRELERYGGARDAIFSIESVPMLPGDSVVVTRFAGPLVDALRAEGALAEREKIRREMLAQAEKRTYGGAFEALFDFAATLEKP